MRGRQAWYLPLMRVEFARGKCAFSMIDSDSKSPRKFGTLSVCAGADFLHRSGIGAPARQALPIFSPAKMLKGLMKTKSGSVLVAQQASAAASGAGAGSFPNQSTHGVEPTPRADMSLPQAVRRERRRSSIVREAAEAAGGAGGAGGGRAGGIPAALRDLPPLADTPAAKREALFKQKLALCSVLFDWDAPDEAAAMAAGGAAAAAAAADARGKELKRVTLLELVEHVNTPGGQKLFTETSLDDVIAMAAANIFRSLPVSFCGGWRCARARPAARGARWRARAHAAHAPATSGYGSCPAACGRRCAPPPRAARIITADAARAPCALLPRSAGAADAAGRRRGDGRRRRGRRGGALPRAGLAALAARVRVFAAFHCLGGGQGASLQEVAAAQAAARAAEEQRRDDDPAPPVAWSPARPRTPQTDDFAAGAGALQLSLPPARPPAPPPPRRPRAPRRPSTRRFATS